MLERHVSHITTPPEMSLVTEHWENKLYNIEIYTQQLQLKCKCMTSTIAIARLWVIDVIFITIVIYLKVHYA